MFLDDVRIFVRAGAGGDGASTMRREAHVPRGGPDGGDGGRGGSVYLRVDAGQTALHDFRYKHHFVAGAGGRGERQKRHGKAGADLFLPVPAGHGRHRPRDRRADRRPRRRRPGGHGRQGRPRRPRQHPLRHRHAPGAQARPARRAGRGEGAAARAPPDRGRGAGGPAQRRQVDAARRPDRRHAPDRGLPVHDARAEPRGPGPRAGGRAAADDRGRPGADRGGVVRGRPRPRVPAPRRADAGAAAHRRRGGPRRRARPRGDPRRARGARPGAPAARPS